MAQVSSGSFNTSSSEGRYLTFKWGVESTNIDENYKEISWSLIGKGVFLCKEHTMQSKIAKLNF